MAREAPVNGAERRKAMPSQAPKQAREAWQMELLLNANRITMLDAKTRSIVVDLLAQLLLEAAARSQRGEADNEA